MAFCTAGFADGTWLNDSFGVQFSGQQTGSVGPLSLTTPINDGVAFSFDLVYQPANLLEVGIGWGPQFFRSMTNYVGSFEFDNLFAIMRIPISAGPFVLYPVGRIGYGFFIGDANYVGPYGSLTGGLYYALGAGLRSPDFVIRLFGQKSLNHIFVEGLYESNSGSYSDSYYLLTANVTYTAFSLYVGWGARFGAVYK